MKSYEEQGDSLEEGDTQGQELTAKEEKFAAMVAAGVSLVDSYRECYNTRGAASTQRVSASRVAARKHVRSRIEELADQDTTNEKISPAYVLKRLKGEAEDYAKGTATSRIRALELLGKAQGMFDDTTLLVVKDRTPSEIEDELTKRLVAIFGTDIFDNDEERPHAELGSGQPESGSSPGSPGKEGEGEDDDTLLLLPPGPFVEA